MKPSWIKNHKNKIITAEEIQKFSGVETQQELKAFVDKLVNDSILTPYGKEKTFKKPQVNLKYKIVEEDNSELKTKINSFKIFDTKYYLKHLDEFKNDEKYLLMIDEYLRSAMPNDIALSVNERSLKIFGDEKFLASTSCAKLLRKIGKTIESFNIYHTPEVFMYYKNNTNTGNILIVENKDTWFTFKKALIDGYSILGMYFDAVILGEGKKILSSFSFISDKEFEQFNNPSNNFYYFGDIDSSGISILYSLMQKYSDFNIIPFLNGYNILINSINDYGHVKYHENQDIKQDGQISLEKIKFCFPNYDANLLFDFCKKNKIIPQETVNNEIIRRGGKNGKL